MARHERVAEATESADARLEAFLRARSADPSNFEVTGYQRIVGGYSRTMAKVWVNDRSGPQGYVVRSDPPIESAFIDTDREQEWDLLQSLHAAGTIPMATPLWCDLTGEELGAPAIVSELIDGPSLLTAAIPCDARERLAMAQRLAELAAAIHTFDLGKLPPHLTVPRSWDEYIDERAQQWTDAERVSEGRDPFMRLIACWLRANKPVAIPLGLVHGDFQPNNAVIHPDGGYRMIDWELAHVGDPREDLGWMNLCGANQPPDLIEADPDAFYARYAELRGLSPDAVNAANIAYFTVLGAGSVFIPMVKQLDAYARREADSVALTYITLGIAGMHNVIVECMARHARETGAVW
jgi:aminoglycoside phosphotransferase (APT) family kinase protein